MKITEIDLVKKLSRHLGRKGYDVFLEIPNMGQSADVVAQKGRWITITEVKLSNWTRALSQCKNHEVIADYIYITVATKKVSERLVVEAERRGYGIIHYNDKTQRFTILLKASINRRIWKPQRKIFLKKLNTIKNAYSTLDDFWNVC